MSQDRTVRLPPPPPQERDTVNDLGWASRGLARRRRAKAEKWLQKFLLRDGEDSGLPPDPEEPPPLPPPPDQEPDVDARGRRRDDSVVRVPGSPREQ